MQRFRVVFFRRVSHQENISGNWDVPRLYHEKRLNNYFVPCHRKCSGQMGRLGVIKSNCTDRCEGSRIFPSQNWGITKIVI